MKKEEAIERAEKLISFVENNIPQFPIHIPPMTIENEKGYKQYVATTVAKIRHMEPLNFYWKNLCLRLLDLKLYFEKA